MHTQILKVRQEGTRAVRVAREFTLEVPHHIANDPQLLKEWTTKQQIDHYWIPEGDAWIEIDETRQVGHSTLAMYPLSEQQTTAR